MSQIVVYNQHFQSVQVQAKLFPLHQIKNGNFITRTKYCAKMVNRCTLLVQFNIN